jgi:hypothetical protein
MLQKASCIDAGGVGTQARGAEHACSCAWPACRGPCRLERVDPMRMVQSMQDHQQEIPVHAALRRTGGGAAGLSLLRLTYVLLGTPAMQPLGSSPIDFTNHASKISSVRAMLGWMGQVAPSRNGSSMYVFG